jgi:hypothetical protein
MIDLHDLPSDRQASGEICEAVRNAQLGIAVADFSVLLGQVLSDVELKAGSRAAARLEASGYSYGFAWASRACD